MKNLFIFLLLVGCGFLFFHDKQQTADLTKAQAQVDQLTQQLTTYQAAYTSLQAANRQLNAQVSAPAPVYHPQSAPQPQQSTGGLQMDHLQDPGGLDRPAYH